MSLVRLHKMLVARLKDLVANFSLETKTGRAAPAVLDGYLPPKPGAEAEQFPFMLVRPTNGVDAEQSAEQDATAVIDIVIGTYSDTDDGWLDVLHLVDAIRADFAEQPTFETPSPFEQTGPMKWALGPHDRPQWFGTVTTNWIVPRPRRAEARNPQEG
jgi:hypothetical protein